MISKYENFNSKRLDIEYIQECFVELLDEDENSIYVEDKFQCVITIQMPIADFKIKDGSANLLDKLGNSYISSSNILKSISNSIDKINLQYKYDIDIEVGYSSDIITQIDMITIDINYE